MQRFGRASTWAIPIVLALCTSLALVWLHDTAYLDSDAAQYLNTARNLLAGKGAATDLLYYEAQYRPGVIPAPQTIFPPGLPVILSGLLAAGAEPGHATLYAGLAAFCATALLLVLFLVRLHVAPLLVALGAALWLLLALAWVNVLEGRSEVAFTAMTLASTFCLFSARPTRTRLLLAGAFAAAALAMRYQAVFYLAALGIWSLVRLLRRERGTLGKAVADAVVLLALPAVATLLIFGRNIALLGAAGGGPIDTVRAGLGGLDLVRAVYWAANDLSGFLLTGPGAAELVAAAGVALLALGLFLARRSRPSLAFSHAPDHVRVSVVLFVLLYVAVAVAGVIYLAATRAGAYLQGRYFVPLLPFVVIAWIVFLDRLRSLRGREFAAVAAGLVLLHAGLLLAQVSVARQWLDDVRADRRIEVIRAALKAPVDGVPLKEYLQRRVTASAPVFAESGQHLWLLLERPVLAPAGAGFSKRRWTVDEVRRMKKCYGVEYVIFFPPLFDVSLPQNANREIFAELSRGQVSPVLEPMLRTSDVQLYRLRSDAALDCSTSKDPR